MNRTLRKILNLSFFCSGLLYLILDDFYEVVFFVLLSIMISFDLIYRALKFQKYKRSLVEIGNIEPFDKGYWLALILMILFVLFLFFLPDLLDKGILTKLSEENEFLFFSIVLYTPTLVNMIIDSRYKQSRSALFMSDKGIVRLFELKESYLWNDFINFKILPNQKILRFRKKNSEFFFISYDEKNFKEHKERILAILDKNLKQENE